MASSDVGSSRLNSIILFSIPRLVSKHAALAQALITLGSACHVIVISSRPSSKHFPSPTCCTLHAIRHPNLLNVVFCSFQLRLLIPRLLTLRQPPTARKYHRRALQRHSPILRRRSTTPCRRSLFPVSREHLVTHASSKSLRRSQRSYLRYTRSKHFNWWPDSHRRYYKCQLVYYDRDFRPL